jgi:hypothetical protein
VIISIPKSLMITSDIVRHSPINKSISICEEGSPMVNEVMIATYVM